VAVGPGEWGPAADVVSDLRIRPPRQQQLDRRCTSELNGEVKRRDVQVGARSRAASARAGGRARPSRPPAGAGRPTPSAQSTPRVRAGRPDRCCGISGFRRRPGRRRAPCPAARR
jgi:hypothetical protein